MTKKLDEDVKGMAVSELRKEVMRLRKAFRAELASTGNQRCWINLLSALPEGRSIDPLTLPEDQFLRNCAAYYARNRAKSEPQLKKRRKR